MTNIQVEDLTEVKKKVTFEVPQQKVLEMMDAEYRDLKKNVQIKGFRKGKVPLDIVRGYFRTKVEADIARKIIEETFQPGLDEKKIVPVSVIKIDPETVEAGKPFKYTAEIEVPPPIEVKDYEGLKLKKYIRELNEKDVDDRIQTLRERNATLKAIPDTRGVAEGDHLVVDIKAESDGAVIPALTVTDYHMELGRNFYLPDFDAKLESLRPDETKELTISLPEDFPRKDLAGKTASFEVRVKEAKERILPEPDDDFAKDLGEFETLEALKEEIRKDLQRSLDDRSEKEIENQIIDALIEKNDFEVPETMVESQIDNFLHQSMRNLAAHGIDPKRFPAPTQAQRDQVRPSAVRIVKAGLILKAVCEQENIEISDEELEAGIAKRAEQMGVTADYLKDQLEEGKMLGELRETLLQEKVYKMIQDRAEVTEEEPPVAEEPQETESEKE
jgi:trigger factor